MQNTIYSCDVCKEEVEKKELRRLIIGYTSYNYGYHQFIVEKGYDLCPACRKKLGLVNDAKDKGETKQQEKTIQERLFDVAVEIAQLVKGGE